MQEWLQLLGDQLKQTDWLQWLGLILGVSEVLLARANKIALYPTGIAASAISIYLFWISGLFAEAVLSLYYVVMSIYGWWYWVKKKNKPLVQISYTTRKEWTTVFAIVVGGYALLFFILNYYTPSTVPHWDAWVTSTAWAGMWLLAKRKVENWILLNISNAFAVPLLLHKDLPLYALLTVILFIVAVQGYFSWKNKLRTDEAN
jgi:nicotinamide mononucleotide transporter